MTDVHQARARAAQPGFTVSLQPGDQFANSLFAADIDNGVRDRRSEIGFDIPLINGATTGLSNPLVLNYPAGNPTGMPRPQPRAARPA